MKAPAVIERGPGRWVVQVDSEDRVREWSFGSKREADFAAAEISLELAGQRLPFWTHRTEGV